MADYIDQGFTPLTVLLAQNHSAYNILMMILREFGKNNLYENLDWLAKNQDENR